LESPDFRQIVESVKLRVPIEDAVRERVPELKRAGALLVACCPFHDEKTPSFKVDPRRGTWRCFGACGTGGDALSFVQQFDGVSFQDALELLAARGGIEMPEGWRGRRREDRSRFEPLFAALERAEAFYRRVLNGVEGAAARSYLESRGLEPATLEAFGVGFSPARGSAILDAGRSEGKRTLDALEASGLVRTSEGRSYDFFRGRLMIPIRDIDGRTVGFGARQLDDSGGPKYVNTPETALFHKGRLIYGLDRALPHTRRDRHLILVEGYTDVMAAHQVGLSNVVAVLGTSTTEEHAGLVRRTGARRVSLLFDGDDAGRRATLGALAGLLPLALELDVVRLPGGQDPCDLLVREGASGLTERLANATEWLEFGIGGLEGLSGAALSEGVDELLRLVGRIKKPVHRESCMRTIAERLELSAEAVRMQARTLGGRRAPAADAGPAARPGGSRSIDADDGRPPSPEDADGDAGQSPGGAPLSPRDRERERRAFRQLAGAVLLDNSLIPAVSEYFEGCPDESIRAIFEIVLELYEADPDGDDEPIDASRVMSALGDSPVRDIVVPLEERARTGESTRQVADGAVACLTRLAAKRSIGASRLDHARAADEESRSRALMDIWNEHRRVKVPVDDSAAR
jgi:DNA primase